MAKSKIVSWLRLYWQFLIIGIFVLVSYSINLDKSTRFIWDESRALVDMHRIWEQKQITFVGPISSDNLEMFPSLSYYMYLLGAVVTNFDPLGPVLMAVFFGIITWIIFTLIAIKIQGNNISSRLTSVFIALTPSLVITSRWAWNPNLVIFWSSIFCLSLLSTKKIFRVVGGAALGFSLYHHYLAAFGVMPALLFLPIYFMREKKWFKSTVYYYCGFALSLLPFIAFEIKNHYYQNSSIFLSANGKSFLSFGLDGYVIRLWNSISILSATILPSGILWTIVAILCLLGYVIFTKDRITRYLSLVLITSTFLYGFVFLNYTHYQYIQVSFLLLLLIRILNFQRVDLRIVTILILIFFSLQNFYKLISTYSWMGDVNAVRKVSEIVVKDTNSSINIASLQGEDTNTTGQRYRDVVLLHGKTLDPSDSYPNSNVLYVVAGTSDKNKIIQDRAWEIESFRNSKVSGPWQVSDYPHYLFRLEK